MSETPILQMLSRSNVIGAYVTLLSQGFALFEKRLEDRVRIVVSAIELVHQ
jgi:hypothetical protein